MNAPVKAQPRDRLPAGLQIERDLLLQLSRPAPVRLLVQASIEWAWIVGTIALARHVDMVWMTIAAIAFIATRQHALLMLMHEFSHRQFSRTRAGLNDALGDFLTAIPLFITIHGFRRDHLQHHRVTSTAQDPNWATATLNERYQFPKSRPRMAWLLMQHCLGIFAIRDVKGYLFDSGMAVNTPRATQLRQAAVALLVVGVASMYQLWTVLALYWLLPMVTVLLALLYLRDVGEHYGMPEPGIEASRTVLVGPLEGFLIAPHAVGFHAEHHLYPSVPFCRLHRLHEALRDRPEYKAKALVTRGYLRGLLGETAGGQHHAAEHDPALDASHGSPAIR